MNRNNQKKKTMIDLKIQKLTYLFLNQNISKKNIKKHLKI